MRSEDGESPIPEDPRNRYRRLHYEQVLVRRQDFARLRQLAYHWNLPRMEALHRLLDLATDSQRTRLVYASPEAWGRLEELARGLGLSGETLVTRILGLASDLSPEQMAAIVAPRPQQP